MRQIVLGYDASADSTGIYNYRIEVTRYRVSFYGPDGRLRAVDARTWAYQDENGSYRSIHVSV